MSDVPQEAAPGRHNEVVLDGAQLSQIADDLRREKAAIGDQIKEIAILIKQTGGEIDRLVERNRELSSSVRQLEANIESFTPTEIKRVYSSFQEGQMKLFMMQSQLEQLRNREANLERLGEVYARILEVIDTPPSRAPESPAPDATAAPDLAVPPEVAAALESIELAQQRLSRELQDGPAQAFSDLILRAEVCERLVDLDAREAKEELARLRQATAAALRSTRQLVQELQPPTLEELGLAAALRRYVEASRASERIRVELQITGQERRLPRGVEVAVFRVVQEALANAAQHSGADRAEVCLRFEPGQLVATVSDKGQGFDASPVLASLKLRDRSGLSDMGLRAKLIGATLEISSKPGAGCVVTLVVPA